MAKCCHAHLLGPQMSLKAFQATFEGSSGKHYKQETKVDGKKLKNKRRRPPGPRPKTVKPVLKRGMKKHAGVR